MSDNRLMFAVGPRLSEPGENETYRVEGVCVAVYDYHFTPLEVLADEPPPHLESALEVFRGNWDLSNPSLIDSFGEENVEVVKTLLLVLQSRNFKLFPNIMVTEQLGYCFEFIAQIV